MKLSKSLTALAIAGGASMLAVAPILNAAEYSASVGGNVRVEATAQNVKRQDMYSDREPVEGGLRDVEILTTGFGGDEEESTTGGDTYLQWNHRLESDNTVATGFIRFNSQGQIRINVQSDSELGNWASKLKAEWQTADGFSGSVAERDQFAELSYTPIGLYYKIGREEWLGNQKGYATDFLSQSKNLAETDGTPTDFGSERFAAHALGWRGGGVDLAFLLQRDNLAGGRVSSPFAVPLRGTELGEAAGDSALREALQFTTVNAYGLLFNYQQSVVDFTLNAGYGDVRSAFGRDDVIFVETGLTIDTGPLTLFANYGWGRLQQRTQNNPDRLRPGVSVDETRNVVHENQGFNVGLLVPLGGVSNLVLAYGGIYTAAGGNEAAGTAASHSTGQAYDVMWATNVDPLKLSLAFSLYDDTDNSRDRIQYGVRMELGF